MQVFGIAMVFIGNASPEQKVHVFHNIFLVSAGLASCFFIISVVLFFLFNVPQIIGIKTGHVQKKEIKVMKEQQRENKGIKERKIRSGTFNNQAEINQETTLLVNNGDFNENVGNMQFVIWKSVEIYHSNEEII